MLTDWQRNGIVQLSTSKRFKTYTVSQQCNSKGRRKSVIENLQHVLRWRWKEDFKERQMPIYLNYTVFSVLKSQKLKTSVYALQLLLPLLGVFSRGAQVSFLFESQEGAMRNLQIIFIDCVASRQLTSFFLFRCFLILHLEVNQLELYSLSLSFSLSIHICVCACDFLLPSIYTIVLHKEVIHWSCLFPKSATVMLFSSNSFYVHTRFTPVQPQVSQRDAPKGDTSRPPHPLQ